MNTRPKSLLLKSLIAAAVLVPAAAWAESAVTTQGVNMRAGPDVSYPQVAFLPRGVGVDVIGCVEGYSWCDVVAGGNRGWVYAGYLATPVYGYNSAPGIIAYQGPTLGIPLISFSIGNYWDNYYRGRPWWNNRAYWYNRDHWREPPRYVEGPRHYGGHENRNWHDDNRGNENREWHGNRGNENQNRGSEWHANGSRGNDAGIPSSTYSREEGGTGRSRGRPNEQQ